MHVLTEDIPPHLDTIAIPVVVLSPTHTTLNVQTKFIKHQVNIVSIFSLRHLTRNCRDPSLFLPSPSGQNPRPGSFVRCFLHTKKRQDETIRKEMPTSYHQRRDATYASNKGCPKRVAVQMPLAMQTAMEENDDEKERSRLASKWFGRESIT
jgi:hypothetical protein